MDDIKTNSELNTGAPKLKHTKKMMVVLGASTVSFYEEGSATKKLCLDSDEMDWLCEKSGFHSDEVIFLIEFMMFKFLGDCEYIGFDTFKNYIKQRCTDLRRIRYINN